MTIACIKPLLPYVYNPNNHRGLSFLFVCFLILNLRIHTLMLEKEDRETLITSHQGQPRPWFLKPEKAMFLGLKDIFIKGDHLRKF